MSAEDQPMSRLPVEILCQIFDEYRQLHLDYGPCWEFYSRWTNITSVCRAWRNVAIGCPSLWTYILENYLTPPQWAAAHFERAGPSAPLHIRWEGYGRKFNASPLTSLVPTNLHRIQVLELEDVESHPGDPQLQTLSSGYAPLLRSLSISCKPRISVLPDDILSAGTPILQKLVLHSCIVKPTAISLLRGITTLELLALFPDDGDPWPCIRDIFEQMPQLAYLKLRHISAPELFDSKSVRGVVTLPSLQKLVCQADFETCKALVKAIAVPPSANVTVDGDFYSSHIPSMTGFRPQWIPPPQMSNNPSTIHPYPQSLHFRSTSSRTALVLWDAFVRLSANVSNEDKYPLGRFFTVFRKTEGPARCPSRLQLHEASRILRAQSLGGIRCMDFGWEWKENDDTCARLIGVWERLASLEELALARTEALDVFLSSYQQCPPSTLPKLKTIRLWRTKFARKSDEEQDRMTGLLQMVGSRFRSGQKIEELLLGLCSGVTQKDLDRLGENVSYVHTM